jgi:hypothetical protein
VRLEAAPRSAARRFVGDAGSGDAACDGKRPNAVFAKLADFPPRGRTPPAPLKSHDNGLLLPSNQTGGGGR